MPLAGMRALQPPPLVSPVDQSRLLRDFTWKTTHILGLDQQNKRAFYVAASGGDGIPSTTPLIHQVRRPFDKGGGLATQQ